MLLEALGFKSLIKNSLKRSTTQRLANLITNKQRISIGKIGSLVQAAIREGDTRLRSLGVTSTLAQGLKGRQACLPYREDSDSSLLSLLRLVTSAGKF